MIGNWERSSPRKPCAMILMLAAYNEYEPLNQNCASYLRQDIIHSLQTKKSAGILPPSVGGHRLQTTKVFTHSYTYSDVVQRMCYIPTHDRDPTHKPDRNGRADRDVLGDRWRFVFGDLSVAKRHSAYQRRHLRQLHYACDCGLG